MNNLCKLLPIVFGCFTFLQGAVESSTKEAEKGVQYLPLMKFNPKINSKEVRKKNKVKQWNTASMAKSLSVPALPLTVNLLSYLPYNIGPIWNQGNYCGNCWNFANTAACSIE